MAREEDKYNGPEIDIGGENSAMYENSGSDTQGNPYIKILQEKLSDNSLDDFYIQRKKYLASRLVPEARELYGEESFAEMSRELKHLEAAYNYYISAGGPAAMAPEEFSSVSGTAAREDTRGYNKSPEISSVHTSKGHGTDARRTAKKNKTVRQEYDSSQPAPFWNIWKILTLLVVLSACAYAYNEVRHYMADRNSTNGTYQTKQEEEYIPEIQKNTESGSARDNRNQAERDSNLNDRYAGEQGTAAAAAVKRFEKHYPDRKGHMVPGTFHSPAHTPAAAPAPRGMFHNSDMRGPQKSDRNIKKNGSQQNGSKINAATAAVVSFGRYPQNSRGEVQPVEWLVLNVKKNGEALLLSRYALEAAPFSQKQLATSWQESYIRKWLNSDFLKKAFTPDEQKMIVYSFIPNKPVEINFSREDASYWSRMLSADLNSAGGSVWSTEGTPQTRDRVFLLSYQEAMSYLDRDTMAAKATDYSLTPAGGRLKIYMPQCDRHGRCSSNDLSGTVPWWLRTPGIDTDYMMIAAGNRIFPVGDKVSREKNGIRPAILVEKLDDRLFTAVE
jgi:hypothetical protein